jgi:hypothetical protein
MKNQIDISSISEQIKPLYLNMRDFNRGEVGKDREIEIDGFRVIFTIKGQVDWYTKLVDTDRNEYETKVYESNVWVVIDAIVDDEGEEMTGFDADLLSEIIRSKIEWE